MALSNDQCLTSQFRSNFEKVYVSILIKNKKNQDYKLGKVISRNLFLK